MFLKNIWSQDVSEIVVKLAFLFVLLVLRIPRLGLGKCYKTGQLQAMVLTVFLTLVKGFNTLRIPYLLFWLVIGYQIRSLITEIQKYRPVASGKEVSIPEIVPYSVRFVEAAFQKQDRQLFRMTLFFQMLVRTLWLKNSHWIHWTEAVCASILVLMKLALGKACRLEFWSAQGDWFQNSRFVHSEVKSLGWI